MAEKDHLISVDMGGTSLDVSLIRRGEIPMTTESWVGDERVAIKMVDVRSAGAGGGSIAWVDSLGLLRVGPQSAGAEPGPACYGKGGEEPTVTDADLLLGYVPSDYFLGGEMPLDMELARRAVQKVAQRLGMETLQAAQAVYTTVNSFMADSIGEISTQRGYDPRDFALVVGGGAGPVHGVAIAECLGISTVIIPDLQPCTVRLACLPWTLVGITPAPISAGWISWTSTMSTGSTKRWKRRPGLP
ncbi:MAG: hydantoinase/oxoprolinase family protein [Candidatus Methylomirabilales bacterium]